MGLCYIVGALLSGRTLTFEGSRVKGRLLLLADFFAEGVRVPEGPLLLAWSRGVQFDAICSSEDVQVLE